MKRSFYSEVILSLMIWVLGLGSLTYMGIRLLSNHQHQQTLFTLSATMQRMSEALKDSQTSYNAEVLHFTQTGQSSEIPAAYRIEIKRTTQDLNGILQETYSFTLVDFENRELLRLVHVRGHRDE